MEVQGSFRRGRLYRMGVEYQQDHSVEVPVDTKKLPRLSVGWVLQEGTADDRNNIPMTATTYHNIPMTVSTTTTTYR